MINLRKAAAIGSVAIFGLLLSACSLYKTSSNGESTGTDTGQQQSQGQTQQSQGPSAATVTFSDSGVSPATVTIKSGESITWVNSGSKAVGVASAPHPTHTDNRELTNGQSVLEIAPGASATATLTKTGNWGFHDHLNPSVGGKVSVQ